MRGFREKAGGRMVADVISLNYSSIMSVVGFFGVFTAKGLSSVWFTRKDLTEMSGKGQRQRRRCRSEALGVGGHRNLGKYV